MRPEYPKGFSPGGMLNERALLRTSFDECIVRTRPIVRLESYVEYESRAASGLNAQRGSHRLGFYAKERSVGGRNLTPLRSGEYFVLVLPTEQSIGFQTRNALITSQGLILG
jgi:hypothetical protein